MADNFVTNLGTGGDTFAADDYIDESGVLCKHQRVKLQTGANNSGADVSSANPLPVNDAGGSLTVDGTVTANAGTGPWPVTDNAGSLTIDAASLPLPAGASTETTLASVNAKTPVLGQAVMAASSPVVIASDQSTLPVSGPLTDAQLRATAVPVSGTVTASGPLTDTQLRATPVSVSGPLTDAQLRASAVPVSAASLPLPTGAATEATLAALNAKVLVFDLDSGAGVQNVQGVGLRKSASGGSVELGTLADPIRSDPTGTTTQPISAVSLPLPTGAASETTLSALNTKVTACNTGAVTISAALPAGAANIGDVDVLTLPSLTAGSANIGTVNGSSIQGDAAHDGVDSGNPMKVGLRAVAHGTNPTAVAAADRTDWYGNRAGVPFVMGGHPNIVTLEAAYTAAQTNTAIVTVAAGLKIVVTEIEALCSNANTVNVDVRIGFGATATPATTGVVLTHPGIAAGSGVVRGNGSGILGVGADGNDLRVTCTVPTTGSIRVLVSYYTIES